MNTKVISPCPFCGGDAAMHHKDPKGAALDDIDAGTYWIACAKCGACTAQRWSLGEDCRPLLVEAWNGRVVGPDTAAALDVLAERCRQIQAECWTPEHDDEHDKGELAQAAACYVLNAQQIPIQCGDSTLWPWAEMWWRPKDRRRDLVRATALLLAEIERMDRAASRAAA